VRPAIERADSSLVCVCVRVCVRVCVCVCVWFFTNSMGPIMSPYSNKYII